MLPPEALSTQGLVFVKRGFLSLDECQQLQRELEQAQQLPSLTFYTVSGPIVDDNYRRTREIKVDPKIRDRISQKIIALQTEMQTYFSLSFEYMEGAQFLCYQPGDFFKAHRDSYDTPNPLNERRLSLVMFINAPREAQIETESHPLYNYDGGFLVFYRNARRPPYQPVGMPLQVAPGMLVAFRPDVLHEVTPVISGQRFTIVTWLT